MTAHITSISNRFGRQVQIDEPMSHIAIHEIPPLESSISGPTVVYTSFIVSPGDAGLWIEIWASLARMAGSWPGCRSFQLLHDRNDSMFVAAMSEWESMEAYTSFMHETRDMGLQQALRHVCVPSEARFLDVIPTSPKVETAV